MKAITVEPLKPGTARYEDVPEPDLRDGSILVEAVAVGVCGTDAEIVEGKYGWAPPGQTRLVLGHESLGRVIDPGPRSSLKKGDLVVGIVRRPDPVPCPNCAVGEWDMCTNGLYTERGIKEIHGFMSERWRIEPEYAIKVDPSLGILGVLLEPTTVVTKAMESVLTLGRRSFWEPKTVVVTGAAEPMPVPTASIDACTLNWKTSPAGVFISAVGVNLRPAAPWAAVMKSPLEMGVMPSFWWSDPPEMPVMAKWVTLAPSAAFGISTRPVVVCVSSVVVADVTTATSATPFTWKVTVAVSTSLARAPLVMPSSSTV
jgi:hypothetical protein